MLTVAWQLSTKPPGANNPSPPVLNVTGTSTYTFNDQDVIESFVRGWISGGYLYDGVAANATSAIQAPADQL